MQDAQIEAAFKRLDLKGTGEIDSKALRELLGSQYDNAEIAALLAEADTTGNGKITLDEFRNVICGTQDIAASAHRLSDA